MKLLVNCDQVFDVLTRGPFPTGDASDEAVEQHLRACHECRQLAEALRPAVELMHEAVGSDVASGLPEYQGSLPEAERLDREPARDAWVLQPPAIDRSLALGVRQLARPAKAIRTEAAYVRVANATRLLAASMLAIAVGTLIVGLMVAPEPEAAVVAVSAGPQAASPLAKAFEDPLVTLAALRLPADCFPLEHRKITTRQAEALLTAMANGQEYTLHCCTECHNAFEPAVPEAGKWVAVAGNSCVACHRG